jgi:O-antigen ligase
VMRVAATAAAAAGALWLLSIFFPLIFEFFDARLFTFLANRDAVEGNLADEETSEGTRIFIWISILEFVAFNPLTGSGYLGVWVLRLFDESSGSAHNQFLDVLFRVGIVGFAIYLALLYRTAALLARHHAALLWGFVGVLAYGMFHETFKESQGGFVLAFLLGMMSQPRASSMPGGGAVQSIHLPTSAHADRPT